MQHRFPLRFEFMVVQFLSLIVYSQSNTYSQRTGLSFYNLSKVPLVVKKRKELTAQIIWGHPERISDFWVGT